MLGWFVLRVPVASGGPARIQVAVMPRSSGAARSHGVAGRRDRDAGIGTGVVAVGRIR